MISVENLGKSFGARTALRSTTLRFEPGKTTVLIGPSGCGKSTLLRLLIALLRPDSGRILIDGSELTETNAESVRLAMGYVIQDGGLFPHLTAGRNVTLLARYLQRPPGWIEERLALLAELVRIPSSALARYPKELSGGQRQRVGLMRALMLDPPLLLMDEPLGALDPITRYELQEELDRLFTRLAKTVIFVTHDMNEAAYFADTIVLMREGQIVQKGSLNDLLKRPAEPFVREFIRAQRSLLPAAID
jgi:osmoprotectant transport system ATP-binding protein